MNLSTVITDLIRFFGRPRRYINDSARRLREKRESARRAEMQRRRYGMIQ